MINISTKFVFINLVMSLLLACSSNESPEELIKKAEAYLQKNKTKEAIIELKNAIQQSPTNMEARLVLGKIYLSSGAALLAEKELSRAYSNGYKHSSTAPPLAQALMLQRKDDEIISLANEIDELDLLAKTSLLVYKAQVHYKRNEDKQASLDIDRANIIDANSVYSKLGSAYQAASQHDITTALLILDKILKQNEYFTDALLLKAHLESFSNETKSAVTSYERYQQLLPEYMQARLYLANAYLKNKEYKKADSQLNFLLSRNFSNSSIHSIKATIHFKNKEFNLAKEHAETALQGSVDPSANHLIAGLSALELNNLEQAYQHLIVIEDELTIDHPAKTALIALQLKLGYSVDTNNIVSELDSLTEKDTKLLAMASYHLLREGDDQQAKKILNKLESFSSTDPLDIARIGIFKLSLNDIEGIADLEKAASLEPDLESIQLALASVLLNNKQYKKALELAKNWQIDRPDEAVGYNLAAISQLKLNDIKSAELSFNQALGINPYNTASLMYFSSKAINEDNFNIASSRLEKLLENKPNYIPGLENYYAVTKKTGRSELARKLIKTAFENNPNDLRYRLLYTKVLVVEKNPTETIKLLDTVKPDKKTPNFFWLALGDSYLSTNNTNKAINTFSAWKKMQPNASLAHMRHIGTLEMSGDINKALEETDLALKYFEFADEFKLVRAQLLLTQGNIVESQKQLNKIDKKYKEEIQVLGLQGKIWLRQDQAEKALPNLISLYQKLPTSKNALYVSIAYLKQKKLLKMEEFLEKHLLNKPNDMLSTSLLAEHLIKTENFDRAIELYRIIIKTDNNNVVALNNLAWLLSQQNNLNEAETIATKATEISPDSADTRDTLGLIQIKLKKYDSAVQNLAVAYKLEPEVKEIKEHYEEALRLSKIQ